MAITFSLSSLLSGTLNSTPRRLMDIDVYSNSKCDPLGYAEGAKYLGSTSVVTDGSGNAFFEIRLDPILGPFNNLTATATRAFARDTSEFSPCLQVDAATPKIGGRRFEDLDGNGEQASAEPGRGGWMIELVDPATGSVLDTAVTRGVDEICPPGPHFVAACPMGGDTFDSVALVELDIDLDNQADEMVLLTGQTTILRGDAVDAILDDPLLGDVGELDGAFDVLPTELVSLALTGDGIILTAGDGVADLANDNDLHSPGAIAELPNDPALASSRFEVFFEIETSAGTLHNSDPLPLTTIIDRIYPQGAHALKFRDDLTAPLSLFDDAGVERARLLRVVHTRDEPGTYEFGGLDPGTYLIREKPEPGWEQVFPASSEYLVSLLPDAPVDDRDFGNMPVPTADVVLNMVSFPEVLSLGEQVTHVLDVTNLSPDPATGVVVTDRLPPEVTFQAANTTHGTCSHSAGTVTCELDGLDGTEVASISIVATTNIAGVASNSSSAIANEFDPHSANNEAAANTLIADFLFRMPTGNGPDAVVLRRDGDDLQIVDATTGQTLASRPVSGSTTVAIIGADGEDDTLTVDFANGDLPLVGGLHFYGGSGGDDSLTLEGGSFEKANYELDNASDGRIQLEGETPLRIHFTGLEPIHDQLAAAHREFTFWGGSEEILLSDEAEPSDGLMRIDSTASESVVFQVPNESLTVGSGSGNDDVILTSRDELLTVPITVRAGEGRDVVDFAAATAPLALFGDGNPRDVLIGGSGNDVLEISGAAFLRAAGGLGRDTLRQNGSGLDLDLHEMPAGSVSGFEAIDVSGNGPNSLSLDANLVMDLSDEPGHFLLRHDKDDTIAYGDGWQVGIPRLVHGEFFHVLLQGTQEIRVANTLPWQNPFNHLDANRDGSVAPIDALVAINSLNESGSRQLAVPVVVGDLPEFYLDTNGDNFAAPIDVLLLINFLNNLPSNPEGETVVAPRHGPFIETSMQFSVCRCCQTTLRARVHDARQRGAAGQTGRGQTRWRTGEVR